MTDHAHPIFAQLYDPVMAGAERTVMIDHREYLAAGLEGRVLDLGAGTGAMFPYFAETDATVHAVEPDPHMRSQAHDRASRLDLDVTIVDGDAETLPFDEGSFDAVVSSLVFCTVPDAEAGLSEVARVLDSGGEFRFLEHVRGEGFAGRIHDVAAPAWHTVAGGCHLNRETGRLFQEDDRFELLGFDRFDGSTGLMPMVRGRLRRSPRRQSRLDRLFGLVGWGSRPR